MTQPKPDYRRRGMFARALLPVLLLISQLFVAAQPPGYAYGKIITIQASKVSGTQTNFPVLISITDPALKQSIYTGGHVRSASGNDILFTTANGSTLLPYQLEKYDKTTGQLVAWVKVPSISSSANTTIALFYGKASVGTSPSTNTIWDANYIGVWHFNNSVNDGSNNGTNLTNKSTTNFTGSIIGDGRQLDNDPFVPSNSASLKYLKLPNNTLNGITNFTFEGWVMVDDNTTSWERIFDFGKSTTVNMFLTPSMATNGIKRFAITTGGNAGEQQVSSGSTTPSGGWHHFAVTIDAASNTSTLYYDGVADATNVGGVTLTPSDMANDNTDYFGRSQYSPDEGFDGKFDEFRLSQSVRSASWIKTSYNNQSNPSTFTVFSAEMTAAAAMSALPVSLHSFDAQAMQNGTVQLVWQTDNETNNESFVIERSSGDEHWDVLTTVAGAGNGTESHRYTAYDNHPFYPVSWYRLKQVDIDGKSAYLSTVAVRLSTAGPGSLVLTPNPARDHVVVTMKGSFQSSTVKLTLTDYQGRAYYPAFTTGGNAITVQTTGLPTGNYALTVYANGMQYAEKLVIAK